VKVLTVDQMREFDRLAIEEFGIPSLVLMENAARSVADAVERHFSGAFAVFVLCGPGNNGGDGLATARQLNARGYDVRCLVGAPADKLSEDARRQLKICQAAKLEIDLVTPAEMAAWVRDEGSLWDVAVDALFGSGLNRPLAGDWGEVVEALNKSPLPIVAVDVPSGINGDTAHPIGPHLDADVTVTFAAPQPAHVLAPALEAVGQLEVADLGVPATLLREAPAALDLLGAEEIRGLLPIRARAAHKGTVGHVLVWAGSPDKSGAAILASRAAGRAGAGLVTLIAAPEVTRIAHVASLESMSISLPGETSPDAMAQRILDAAAERTVLAAGPGLGTAPPVPEVVRLVVRDCPVPMVLDADALNAFSGDAEGLAERRSPAVITPHPGELGRLLEISPDEVQEDRLAAARRAAESTGCIVVLKGYRTLVALPEEGTLVCPTGGPALASGGTGDVLTGMIAGLMAQGLEPHHAAAAAVYLHGLTGDRLAEQRGEAGLLAGDLIEALPKVQANLLAG